MMQSPQLAAVVVLVRGQQKRSQAAPAAVAVRVRRLAGLTRVLARLVKATTAAMAQA